MLKAKIILYKHIKITKLFLFSFHYNIYVYANVNNKSKSKRLKHDVQQNKKHLNRYKMKTISYNNIFI